MPATLAQIIAATSFVAKLDTYTLLSRNRRPRVALPRQVGMWIARRHGYSYPRIGLRFGRRDHTTAIHAERRVEALLEKDEKVRALVSEIEAVLARIAARVQRAQTGEQR